MDRETIFTFFTLRGGGGAGAAAAAALPTGVTALAWGTFSLSGGTRGWNDGTGCDGLAGAGEGLDLGGGGTFGVLRRVRMGESEGAEDSRAKATFLLSGPGRGGGGTAAISGGLVCWC